MIRFFSMLPFILAALLTAAPQEPPPLPPEQVSEIIINNRILTRVGDKNITVLDVVKQMDVFLNRHYPHYLNSNTARYQFYTMHWKTTLQQIIDNELMTADAESKDIKVTDGDVREEIQSRFGPNVMGTLDQLGLSYEEARKLVQQEMVVQRIQGFRVTSKVLQKVSTQNIKDAYKQFLQENPPKDLWKYQFVTIRSDNSETMQNLASQLVALKEKSQTSLAAAVDLLKEQLPPESTTTLTVSQEFDTEEKALSQTHRETLSQLEIGKWSQPTLQTSRDGTSVVRIFHLKNHTKERPPVFTAVANSLRMQLLNDIADQELKTYRAKLYQRFNFDDRLIDIPPNFEPFIAR